MMQVGLIYGFYRQYNPESVVDKERNGKEENDCAARFIGHGKVVRLRSEICRAIWHPLGFGSESINLLHTVNALNMVPQTLLQQHGGVAGADGAGAVAGAARRRTSTIKAKPWIMVDIDK
jgi:hypothetical protein